MFDWHNFNCLSESLVGIGESKGNADLYIYLLDPKGNFLNLLNWAYFCSAEFSTNLGVLPVMVLNFFGFSGK